LLRLYTADGASALRCFVVGDQRESAEAEPNDELAKAQHVDQLPVTINGQLDKNGDVDCYAIQLAPGQRLVASVQGRRLGSAIDPMLHLVDAEGNQVAYAQDGLGLDPLLVYEAPSAGTYVLRVSAFAFPPVADVRLAGGKDGVYRLSLTTGPFVRAVHPSGVKRGQKSTVRLIGWNLPSDRTDIDATATPAGVDHLFIPVPGGEGRLRVDVVDSTEVVRASGAASAPPVTAPANVSGTVASAAGDRFELATKKGERLSLIVRTVSTGSPLDAVLRIEDSAGKLLDSNDDGAGAGDPRLDWTAPADGVYRLVIHDLYGRSGDDFLYCCSIQPPTPEVRATTDAEAYALVPGKSVPVKVNVARKNGHTAGLVVVAIALPAGVTATSAEIPAKGGEVTLTLSAAADAKPASGPIRILLLGTHPDQPFGSPATFDLRKDRDKAGNQDFIESTPDVWLTLSPTAATGTKPAP
jgi:hypothetical protein